jgi:hypothetical protein
MRQCNRVVGVGMDAVPSESSIDCPSGARLKNYITQMISLNLIMVVQSFFSNVLHDFVHIGDMCTKSVQCLVPHAAARRNAERVLAVPYDKDPPSPNHVNARRPPAAAASASSGVSTPGWLAPRNWRAGGGACR